MSEAKKHRTMGVPTPNENIETRPERPEMVITDTVRRGTKQKQRMLRMVMRPSVIGVDPRIALSWLVKRSLLRPRNADCIVYDAAGNKIAVMDGETGERKNA